MRRFKDVLIITHRNADVDGVASSIALKMLVRAANPAARVDLVAPEGVSLQSKRVLGVLGEAFSETVGDGDYDAVFITDTGHSALLADELEALRKARGRKILVDHHPLDGSMKEIADEVRVDEAASSASEMVYRLFLENRKRIDRDSAFVLALGIMADSQFLTIAKSSTIEAMARLLGKGVDIEEVRKVLRSRREISEQIARIKGVRRAKFHRCADWVVGVTEIGSYHSSTARALVEVGCDISAAVGRAGRETRMSARATQSFHTATKLHVGTDVCRCIAEATGGSGGGHPTAGSLNTQAEPRDVVKRFLDAVVSALNEKLVEIG
ncbi:MAG: DHH family phosphoesterase [Nitrososphaerota archaeon]|nr:DHH family phosphoesterase [Nitrososphaerota archaeon]MDG6939565.1 DHH family phosphoesterase [Nitrososphaerota archaeon]